MAAQTLVSEPRAGTNAKKKYTCFHQGESCAVEAALNRSGWLRSFRERIFRFFLALYPTFHRLRSVSTLHTPTESMLAAKVRSSPCDITRSAQSFMTEVPGGTITAEPYDAHQPAAAKQRRAKLHLVCLTLEPGLDRSGHATKKTKARVGANQWE